MKVLVNCWRQSFMAIVWTAALGLVTGEISQTPAAEEEGHVPLIKVPADGDGEAAKKEHDGAHRDVRETPREDRKQEARPERETGREGGAEREAHLREISQRRAHLLEEAAGIRRRLEALKPDQDGEARELKGALERIEAQLRELQGPSLGADRERQQMRLEELKAAFRRAQEGGRADEAERLAREARELMRALEQRSGDRPADRPEGEEAQRRLQHIRAAVENLRAAGLHEQANALTHQAEALARGERPAAAEGARDLPAAAPQMERAVAELRGQVQELRQQMEEIRRHLKELAERR